MVATPNYVHSKTGKNIMVLYLHVGRVLGDLDHLYTWRNLYWSEISLLC